jgi:hypothetical protein
MNKREHVREGQMTNLHDAPASGATLEWVRTRRMLRCWVGTLAAAGGNLMDGIVGIVVVVLIVLFVLGYFGRGRFRS